MRKAGVAEQRKFKPIYLQIKEDLEDRIRKGDFAPGDFLPPERELAAQFGVNQLTLRKALSELKKDGVVTARRGSGNRVNRKPIGRRMRIGVLPMGRSRGNTQDFYGRILMGMEAEVADRNGAILLASLSPDEGIQPLDEIVGGEALSGIVLLGIMLEEMVQQAASYGIPCVSIDYASPRPAMDAVVPDDEKAGFEATQHLIDLGHRHIAYLGALRYGSGKPYREASSAKRMAGYRRALRKAGLNNSHVAESLMVPAEARQAFEGLRKAEPRLSALVAFDDQIASGVHQALKATQQRIPKDISMVSFGFASMADPFTHRPTRMILAEPEQLASSAMSMLFERIEGTCKAGWRTVKFPMELHPGESSIPYSKKARKTRRKIG